MTKQKLKEIENRFYILQKQYYSLKDNKDEQKKVWDQMFFILHNAILAAVKKCLIGVKRNDVEDLAMDATIQVMTRYKKHAYYEIKYLLTSARFAAIGILYKDGIVKDIAEASDMLNMESLTFKPQKRYLFQLV